MGRASGFPSPRRSFAPTGGRSRCSPFRDGGPRRSSACPWRETRQQKGSRSSRSPHQEQGSMGADLFRQMQEEGRLQPRVPVATYRLQFNRAFTFRGAGEVVPYLDALGISDLYVSSYLAARPGSPHGYDIADHNRLNPEIGAEGEYEQFIAALHSRGMGQILDV